MTALPRVDERIHDVVVADGTYRVLMTPHQRVVTALDLPASSLGPLHVAMPVNRSPWLPPNVSPDVFHVPANVRLWPDVRRAMRDASARTFEAATAVSPRVATPALRVTSNAASDLTERLRRLGPLAPHHHHAAHFLLRIHLGDFHAKSLFRRILHDAKAGIESARHAANALLDASKIVAKVVDAPVLLTSHIPVVGGLVKAVSPFEQFEHVVTAVQHGDFKGLEQILKSDLSMAQGVLSLVPGVGTGVSAAVSAGLAALEGGNGIEIALKTAYGMIPIPPGIRQMTDTVLDTALAFVEHPHNFTDAALQIARGKIPDGLPRTVFDSLVHILVKHIPLQKEALALAGNALNRYAGGALAVGTKALGVTAAQGVAGHVLADGIKAIGLHPAAAASALEGVLGNAVPTTARKVAGSLIGEGLKAMKPPFGVNVSNVASIGSAAVQLTSL